MASSSVQTKHFETAVPRIFAIEERSEVLAKHVEAALSDGYEIEESSETAAILVKGKPLNHWLHFLVSVLTAGIWLVGWVALSVKGGETRVMLSVDEHGVVTKRHMGRDRVLLDWPWKRMSSASYTTEVNASPQEVSDRIARLTFMNATGWWGTQVSGLEGPLNRGSTFAITTVWGSKESTNVFEVLEFASGRNLIYETQHSASVLGGRRRDSWGVEPSGAGCRLSYRREMTRFINYRFHPLVTVASLLAGTLTTLTFWMLVFGVFMLAFMLPAIKWDCRTLVRRIKKQAEAPV